MSFHGTYGDEEPETEDVDQVDLSDTEADIHEEGRALTDDSKDLGEKLDDFLTRRERDA